jgi:hypothetical protein
MLGIKMTLPKNHAYRRSYPRNAKHLVQEREFYGDLMAKIIK